MKQVPEVLHTPSWEWLRTTVRDRVEADGTAATVRIDLDALTADERKVLGWLLGMRATRQGEIRVPLKRLDTALSEKVTEGVDLRTTLMALKGDTLGDQRADRRQAKADKVIADRLRYDEAVRLVSGLTDLNITDLEHELEGLLATPPNPTLRVPESSRSGTSKWPVYERALRAAVIWWTDHYEGHKPKAQELAGRAWLNTKTEWTMPRRFAFGNLVNRSFDIAVEEADTELRMRGPLIWNAKGTIAKASTARPWIGLPALGLRTLGKTVFNARGVLLVENKEAFQAVCDRPEIVDSWLCVWGEGYASDGLVNFLEAREVPIASWQDLDAYGIDIIRNLSARLGRTIEPIGMSIELWQNGVKLIQSEKKLAGARKLARQLAVSGPEKLRELAARIAETGDACEHQTLHKQVLPTLRRDLNVLEEGYYG